MLMIVLMILTVAAYAVGVLIRYRLDLGAFEPTLFAIVLVAAALMISGAGYRHYAHAAKPLSALLTPAVVALAVPLHRNRQLLVRHAAPLMIGALAGVTVGLLVSELGNLCSPLSRAWSLALMSRSATTPIAIAIAEQLHGHAALSAVLAIVTGVFGGTIGPYWLDATRVRAPLARGIAHGIACHGVGTARMLREGAQQAAAAAVGMALGGTLIALIVPLLYR